MRCIYSDAGQARYYLESWETMRVRNQHEFSVDENTGVLNCKWINAIWTVDTALDTALAVIRECQQRRIHKVLLDERAVDFSVCKPQERIELMRYLGSVIPPGLSVASINRENTLIEGLGQQMVGSGFDVCITHSETVACSFLSTPRDFSIDQWADIGRALDRCHQERSYFLALRDMLDLSPERLAAVRSCVAILESVDDVKLQKMPGVMEITERLLQYNISEKWLANLVTALDELFSPKGT